MGEYAINFNQVILKAFPLAGMAGGSNAFPVSSPFKKNI